MLKETFEEKGRFKGCLPFLISGAVIGVLAALFFFDKLSETFAMHKSMGMVAGFLGGLVLGIFAGGLAGLIFGRIMTFLKKDEDDF